MKALVKPYLHNWRLGVVAFITFVLYSTIIKCLMAASGMAGLLQGSPLLGTLITGIPFVVVIVPLFGWIFGFAIKQAALLTKTGDSPEDKPVAPAKIQPRAKSRGKARNNRSPRVAGATASKA